MDQNKKDKLKAAGWKVGSVKDFLNLSDNEAKAIEEELKKIKNKSVKK